MGTTNYPGLFSETSVVIVPHVYERRGSQSEEMAGAKIREYRLSDPKESGYLRETGQTFKLRGSWNSNEE